MENRHLKRPRLSSQQQQPFLTNNNRKTQNKQTDLCLRFQRGICDYGSRCCFIHVKKQLTQNHNPTSIREDSKPCWKYMNGEVCQYGDNCHFGHSKNGRVSAAIDVVNVSEKVGCQKVEMKRDMTKPFRTRLCHRWMTNGSCRYGNTCFFAHGVSELQNQRFKDPPCEWVVKTCEENMDGKQWEFKWKNIDMISRVYADWINDTPLGV